MDYYHDNENEDENIEEQNGEAENEPENEEPDAEITEYDDDTESKVSTRHELPAQSRSQPERLM